MSESSKHLILKVLIAAVWLVNGFFCKVLNLVPRHREIVAAILGNEHARTVTVLIGIAETVMAVWILSGWLSRWSAIVQIAAIAVMNVLEFILVPELLLWGRANALFALVLIIVIAFNEFYSTKKTEVSA